MTTVLITITAIIPATVVVITTMTIRPTVLVITTMTIRPTVLVSTMPLITIIPEPVIPVPMIMSPILYVTIPPDIFDTMSSDNWRELEIPDTSPWPSVVMGTVPTAITENEIFITIVNDVIRSAIGYRVTIVIQIDEIRSV